MVLRVSGRVGSCRFIIWYVWGILCGHGCRKNPPFCFIITYLCFNSIKTLLKPKISLSKRDLQKIICIFVAQFTGLLY
jgi:hypothetical protein